MTRKKKTKRATLANESQKMSKNVMLADKIYPYPERLHVVKDAVRSDVFCLSMHGSAYITVSNQQGEDTVNYVREDVLPKYSEGPLKESITKKDEELLIVKDQVESLRAARTAIFMTIAIRLKKLMMKNAILFGVTALIVFVGGPFVQKIIASPFDILVWSLLWILAVVQTTSLFNEEIKHWESNKK